MLRLHQYDTLFLLLAFAEYAVLPNASNYQKVSKPSASVPWSAYVGVLGWPGNSISPESCATADCRLCSGKTSYYGYLEFVRDYAKKVTILRFGRILFWYLRILR